MATLDLTWSKLARIGLGLLVISVGFASVVLSADAKERRSLKTGPCAAGFVASATRTEAGSEVYECTKELRCEGGGPHRGT